MSDEDQTIIEESTGDLWHWHWCESEDDDCVVIRRQRKQEVLSPEAEAAVRDAVEMAGRKYDPPKPYSDIDEEDDIHIPLRVLEAIAAAAGNDRTKASPL